MVRKPARLKYRFTVYWPDGHQERGPLVLDRPTTEAEAESEVRKQIAHYFGRWSVLRGVCLVKGELTDMFIGELAVLNKMPINITEFFRAARLLANPSVDPKTLPNITGPAVVFDKPIWPRTASQSNRATLILVPTGRGKGGRASVWTPEHCRLPHRQLGGSRRHRLV